MLCNFPETPIDSSKWTPLISSLKGKLERIIRDI